MCACVCVCVCVCVRVCVCVLCVCVCVHVCVCDYVNVMLIFLKDTSQRGSGIRRFGSTTAAFISDYNDTYKQVYK